VNNQINKKGGLLNIANVISLMVVISIVALIVVFISAVWIYGFGEITTAIKSADSTAESNLSYYGGEVIFGNLNLGFRQLTWITYGLIFGTILGMFIGMFTIREHPGFFAIYSVFSIVAIIFSIFISRTYETLYSEGGILGSSLAIFKGSSWILLYLPIWITSLVFIGGILMFVIWNRDSEQGDIV